MKPTVGQLLSRARSLADEFNQGGETTSKLIDEAITVDREAIKLCPPGHPMRASSLRRLSFDLSSRYQRLGNIADLDEAIDLEREALELCPQGNPGRWTSLVNLAVYLFSHFKKFGRITYLDRAIVFGREALVLWSQGHPNRSTSLNSLAYHLFTRYNKFGNIVDLNEAIALERESLELRPKGHPDRPFYSSRLAFFLSSRYEKLGTVTDLNEATILNREALRLRPEGHPDHPASLDSLAHNLFSKYRKFGAIMDLNEAITLNQELLQLRPEGHLDRPTSLINLGIHLSLRCYRFGVIADLNDAIILGRDALALCPEGHPERSRSLNNLAHHLLDCYRRFHAVTDLNEAIILSREAVILCPEGHQDRFLSLSDLAIQLSDRYAKFGGIADLNEAIALDREVLALCPGGHPRHIEALVILADHLSYRYDQFGMMQDLNEAIALHRESLGLQPEDCTDRSTSLSDLAVDLFFRYKEFCAITDLNEAIDLDRQALKLLPEGHPGRSRSLINLANHLAARHDHPSISRDLDTSTSSTNQEEIFSLYTQLANLSHMASSYDLGACVAWIYAAREFEHSSILLAYGTYLRLLVEHLSLLSHLPHHLAILKEHTLSLAMDAFSACLYYQAPRHAVELLEQGRSVFWNQLTCPQSSLDDVIASSPRGEILAGKLARLAARIQTVFQLLGKDQHDHVCCLNLEMQRVVHAIRELPGFSRFLLLPLFSDLQHAASEGPVIIVNASQYGCDVLIVINDGDPVHIPLSITREYVQLLSKKLRRLHRRANSKDERNALGGILRELWDDIVSPVVRFLQTIRPLRSRIWWCPTDAFSDLPLHAAGPYRKGQPNLVDLYISSYTPTLSALIHARRTHTSRPADHVKRFVAIGQANAVGEQRLLSVHSELARIGRDVGAAATFTQIEGTHLQFPRVAGELRKNEWVHFACHGLANHKAPFESAFALSDGRFSISQMIGFQSKDAEFAYLSACQTTVGDEESLDEAIHLASAMQFIGFRSVIGTMWSVDDEATNAITSAFYERMLDDSGCLDYTRAALALNETMRSLAHRLTIDQQILYVHLGA